jgi:hypothetical protein
VVDVMIIVDIAVMIVTADMAAVIETMDTLHEESTDMLAMIDIAAVEVMIDEEVAEDTLIVMTEELTAPHAMLLLLPAAMVIQHLLGNHTPEVEASMMRDSPVENIDR